MSHDGRRRTRRGAYGSPALIALLGITAATAAAPAGDSSDAGASSAPAHCLPSRDGYFRAHLAGAVEARIDWPDRGTRCEGDSKDIPPAGVRLSFHRIRDSDSKLLFVFGLTGVREGRPAREVGTNLTLFVQGTDRVYGTLGDSRCTVDSLKQRPLSRGPSGSSRAYRLEARGFCTQPAHAVRGAGEVLVSTFEFAGVVNYDGSAEPKPASE
ncbi:MAG TPA: hypothetical protein VHY75_12790 [Steroidobacteraceae bacterium]|jgi:hypothetical protein|nr:hypothetical protein [Steroidobacteraceae bacterium]